ncbi:MAG: TonB-dependent receptor [Myxococcales bacterium]|nr:TonB-dependent receptor [Myxococcales bacterium]
MTKRIAAAPNLLWALWVLIVGSGSARAQPTDPPVPQPDDPPAVVDTAPAEAVSPPPAEQAEGPVPSEPPTPPPEPSPSEAAPTAPETTEARGAALPEPVDDGPNGRPARPAARGAAEEPRATSGIPPALRLQEGGAVALDAQKPPEDGRITFQEIVNPTIISASRRKEGALDAPASVITISADEIEKRGYTELTEFLDDLPGMDVIRPYGDTYLLPYWRGFRNDISSPFLFMIDGVVWNHLLFSDTEIMASVPLSNIEQIEIVYGPASALYGPNAAMGIINVITKQAEDPDSDSLTAGKGLNVRSTLSFRTPTSKVRLGDMTKIADAHVMWREGDLSVSATARFDIGVLEPAIGEQWEYTRDRYYGDRRLWGDFVDQPELAGAFRSVHDKRGADLRVRYKGTELGFQYYRLLSGTGTVYPADLVQNQPPDVSRERGVFLLHRQSLSAHIVSLTMARYRESDVPNPTSFLSRRPNGTARLLYSQSNNSGFEVTEDLVIDVGRIRAVDGDNLQLNFGVRYARRDLQRRYTVTGGDAFWPVDESFEDGYEFPVPPAADRIDLENRVDADVAGLYGMARYTLLEDHSIDVGLRADYTGLLDQTLTTFRGGYVGHLLDLLTVKLLYGQAFQAPGPRVLFGLSDEQSRNLRAETSETLEAAVDLLTDNLAITTSAYFVDYGDAIQGVSGFYSNMPDRKMAGLDVGVRAMLPVMRGLSVWAYYSGYFFVQESNFEFGEDGVPFFTDELVDVGDLAAHKLLGGATLELNSQLFVTLLGRLIGSRDPFKLNPLGPVPSYFTLDTNLIYRLPEMFDGMSLALRITNLLDADYAHPGILNADASNTPGAFDPDTGTWSGSNGFYNARLPQPGRAVTLSVRLDL